MYPKVFGQDEMRPTLQSSKSTTNFASDERGPNKITTGRNSTKPCIKTKISYDNDDIPAPQRINLYEARSGSTSRYTARKASADSGRVISTDHDFYKSK